MALQFPQIDPVAIAIGPLQIRWYALAYLAGFLLGWLYCAYLTTLYPKHKPEKQDIEDFMPWAVLGVILGGRLGYVLFYNLDYYLANPWTSVDFYGYALTLPSVLAVWSGGMAFHGGVIGVVSAIIGFCLLRKINILRFGDIICACLPIGLGLGRLANFVNGELYGRITDVPWAFVFPGGGEVARHPSQLYEAGLEGVALFLILAALIHQDYIRRKPGFVAASFLFGYGAFRFFVEFFREPDAHLGFVFGWMSMGQILCLPMIVAGLSLITYALSRRLPA